MPTITIQPVLKAGVGEYFCSPDALYCVEAIDAGRALVEDCRTGTLVDISVTELLALRPVLRPE